MSFGFEFCTCFVSACSSEIPGSFPTTAAIECTCRNIKALVLIIFEQRYLWPNADGRMWPAVPML